MPDINELPIMNKKALQSKRGANMFYQNIETKRLLLKDIGYEDRDFMLKQFSDSDVNEFLYDAEPLSSLEEADELIDFYTAGEPKNQHRWIIMDRESGEKIGTCGFHCLNEYEKCVDVGYDLQKEYWGKGIMAEAMNAMLSKYLPKLGVKKVFAHIAVGNLHSERLAEKLGFVPSGNTEILDFQIGRAHV